MDDKFIGSESTPSPQKGTISGEGQPRPEGGVAPTVEVTDVDSEIYYVTTHGGLDAPPQSFEDKSGNWKTIHSSNPFEILYLDYKQYRVITPEIVKKNYDVLSGFWQGKARLMMGGAREKIKERYGEDTVNNAVKILTAACNKLKTSEGIELYFSEIDKKRYSDGITAIQELADVCLDDGELTKNEANRIIAKGIANKLEENEVADYLLSRMKEAGLKPSAPAVQGGNLFDKPWMTDAKRRDYETRQTIWLDTSVSTLEQVGEATFFNKEKAYERLSNANYLPVVVTRLTNDNKGIEFEKIINEEKDADKRFLKVVYRLNALLPFVLNGVAFKNIKDILDASANDYALYSELFFSFQKGHLYIWLTETDPAAAAKFTGGESYADFLHFIFKVDSTHPFYLKEHRFETPQQMAAAADNNITIWPIIAGGMYYNELPAWFAAIGHTDWVQAYNEQFNHFTGSTYHNQNEKEMAAVQTLLLIIDATQKAPEIIAEPAEVKMLDVQGSDKVQYKILLNLSGKGFVKAKLNLSANFPGISLSENEVLFHSQKNIASKEIYVYVDGMQLIKDKLYAFDVNVETAYQQLAIPAQVKAVFPKRAFAILLIKYGLFGAALFGLIRFAAGSINNTKEIFTPNNMLSLSGNAVFYFCLLAVLIGILLGSVFLIKKVEKL